MYMDENQNERIAVRDNYGKRLFDLNRRDGKEYIEFKNGRSIERIELSVLMETMKLNHYGSTL